MIVEEVMEPRPMMDRLEAVFSIVPKAHAIADIGTDTGYLAVEHINRLNMSLPVMYIKVR